MKTVSTYIEEFVQIRKQTELIVSPLEIEDFAAQPIIDVSPPKWHLGHTTWFFENFILSTFVSDYKFFDKSFLFLFNSYYVSQGERLARNRRSVLTRPSTKRIFEYRKYVDQEILNFLQKGTVGKEAIKFLEIGLNHEQQHQELLITDIKYIYSQNPLAPIYQNREIISSNYVSSNLLTIKEGVYEVGHQGDDFCFDNELGLHRVYINSFNFVDRLVTNAEYLEFIEDNGYSRPELWLSEGWDWLSENNINAPEYWFKEDGNWKHFTVFGVLDLNQYDTLTHVSFYEAEAYARWKNMRLLTEQEWEVAATIYGNRNNKNHFQESNVFHLGQAKDNQLFGTAWEWTNSAYLPYPNYKQEEGALGEYNGKFMINQMVLRGGSCATPAKHFRKTYRNFFHPNLRWQYTGIRLAENI